MMIKIEVTGNSIPEVADKLLALGASLRHVGMSNDFGTPLPEVAEAAPPPKPKAPSTKSSTPVESTSNGQPSAPSEPELVPSSAPASPTPPPSVSDEPAEEIATLNFETQVAPVVLLFVQKRSKEETSKILAEFGVERASMLDPALWPELVARLEAEMS